jgi:hypothetical protein
MDEIKKEDVDKYAEQFAGDLRRKFVEFVKSNGDGAVKMENNDNPPDGATEEKDPVFELNIPPEENIISRWCRYAGQVMDSYPEYHLASALVLFSHIFDAYMEPRSGKINNNLWGILLGRSSVSGKTTACNALLNIARDPKFLNKLHTLPPKVTPEAFLAAFSTDVSDTKKTVGHQRKLHYLSEASGFLKYIKKDNYSELNELIIDAYDGSRLEKETVSTGLICQYDPRYSGLWTTVQDVFGEQVEPERFRSGAFIRAFYILPDRQKEIKEDLPRDSETEKEKEMVINEIWALLKTVNDKPIRFEENKKLSKWKKDMREAIADNTIYSNIEQSAWYRIFDITRKVAMNLTLASREFRESIVKDTINPVISAEIPDIYADIAINWAQTVFYPNAMKAHRLTWGAGNCAKVMIALQGGKELKRTEIADMVHLCGKRLDEFLQELPLAYTDRPCPPSKRMARFYRLA